MGDSETWPNAGERLVDELNGHRGRFALIVGSPRTNDQLVSRLSESLGLSVCYLGAALSEHPHPPNAPAVEAAIGDASIVTDIDVLMWPALDVPPLPLLRRLARSRATIAVWPGDITNGRARYSTPGRPDFCDERLSAVSVLKPRPQRFPDEIPYEMERLP